MKFSAIPSDKFENIATTSIIEHIEFKDFLNDNFNIKRILTCPTNAIDIDKKEITIDCIDCGICWLNYPAYVKPNNISTDISKFRKYLSKDKMFIYKWLALCIKDTSGINIKSKGFSRVKRIPLIIKSKKRLYLIKSVYEFADIEKAEYELNDIIDLISEEINGYEIGKLIIVIEQCDSKLKIKSYIISFDTLYKMIIEKSI